MHKINANKWKNYAGIWAKIYMYVLQYNWKTYSIKKKKHFENITNVSCSMTFQKAADCLNISELNQIRIFFFSLFISFVSGHSMFPRFDTNLPFFPLASQMKTGKKKRTIVYIFWCSFHAGRRRPPFVTQ